jgi:hypothetical protein
MKTLLLTAFVIAASASLALAQMGGGIGLNSDTQGIDCNLFDVAPGLVTIYAVHEALPGSITAATASQFAATNPACLLATYLSDTAVFPVTIGNSQSGVAIGYGQCLALPLTVLWINYFAAGATPPCCEHTVTADPSAPSGQVEVVDCAGILLTAVGLCAIWNPDPTCPCEATPVEETTWGHIKAVYSE